MNRIAAEGEQKRRPDYSRKIAAVGSRNDLASRWRCASERKKPAEAGLYQVVTDLSYFSRLTATLHTMAATMGGQCA
jgi:hypothetical protein